VNVPFSLSPGLLVNDPEYAPFGAAWLRGVTPARLAVVVAVCFLIALPSPGARIDFQLGNYAVGAWKIWDRMGRTLACAIPLLFLVIWTEMRTARSPVRERQLALASAVLVGSLAYAALRLGLRILNGNAPPEPGYYVAVAYFSRAVIAGGILTAILFFAARERDAQRLLNRTLLARVDIERQGVEARLQLLQAQIEPHFLFNSLASVKRLYEKEPGEGRELLRNLRECLRVATSRGRQQESRLGDEVALVRSFLAIFQVRMGRRLRVQIDIPTPLEGALIPPLMVGTLVENAIKHGIASRASGGNIALTARRDGDHLMVGVRDDGVGFRVPSGYGVGLANIRARLATLFGDAGDLDLSSNPEGGTTATLRLPFRTAPGAA
jgi:signal transduction histidine kinase